MIEVLVVGRVVATTGDYYQHHYEGHQGKEQQDAPYADFLGTPQRHDHVVVVVIIERRPRRRGRIQRMRLVLLLLHGSGGWRAGKRMVGSVIIMMMILGHGQGGEGG